MNKIIGIPLSTEIHQGLKHDLRKVGRDIYELLTDTGRYGYKQRKHNQTIKIEPEKCYAPSEVAAALNLSYDAACRFMLKMKGVVDYGTPTRRYKRGKKKLRISGKNLLEFQREARRETRICPSFC